MRKWTPIDALMNAIGNGWVYTSTRYMNPKMGKPGEIIEKMPEDQREALKALTSDDIKNVRPMA